MTVGLVVGVVLVLPIVVLVIDLGRTILEGFRLGRQEEDRLGTGRRESLSPPAASTTAAGGPTSPASGPGAARGCADTDAQAADLLMRLHDFGLLRSRRLQNLAMVTAIGGVILVYAGIGVTMGFLPAPFARPTPLAGGTLSGLAGLSISLVTGTILREARFAQHDLTAQRAQLTTYVRGIQRERAGLETLRTPLPGEVDPVAAEISLLLVGDANGAQPTGSPTGRGSKKRRKRSKGARAASPAQAPVTDAQDELTEVDLSEAEAVDRS